MESTTNSRLANNRMRLQTAKAQAAKLNKLKAQMNDQQFSSRRGTIGKNINSGRSKRRNEFAGPGSGGGSNRKHRNLNKTQQAFLKRQQQMRRRNQQLFRLKNQLKRKALNQRMKPGASTIYGSGEHPSNRYNRRLDTRGDYPQNYNSPPNIMQNHYDREYSNTFNEPFPSPPKKPFDPPNIFSQGHPGETRNWEKNIGSANEDGDRLYNSGKIHNFYSHI